MEMTVIHHHSGEVEQMHLDTDSDGHGGGDHILAQSFLDVIAGRARPNSTLRDGLLSAAMCLAARESAKTKTFQPVQGV
jgi:predicted dehydrogenase